MSANKTRFLLVTLLALVGTLAMMGQRPVSAALVPASDAGASVASLSASLQVTATATLTATKTVTPTVAAATATKTVTPTVAAATATKTVTPTVVAATATKTVTPTVAAATATKTVTPTVAAATATKTSTRVPATATKTATPAPTKTATTAARLGPRAGTVASLSTAFMVQNLDQAITATVTAQFYNAGGTLVSSVSVAPGPNKGASIDQRATGGGLDGYTSWNGSVVLSSNTQIAAIVNEVSGSSAVLGMDYRADSYNGIASTAGATSVLLPQLLKGVYDSAQNKTFNSLIAIQNTSLSVSANVTVTYYSTPLGNVNHSGIVIPAGSSASVDMTTELSGVGAWLGGATVTADQPVAVIVNQNAAGALQIYPGFTSANAATNPPYTLYVPQLMKNVYDSVQGYTYGTGLMVMTLNQSTAEVYVTYSNAVNGHTITDHKTANPSASFDQRYDAALSAENPLFASAIVTSTTPIVALVNIVTNFDPSRGSRAETYRAIPDGGGTNTVFVPQLLKNLQDTGQNVTWGTAIAGAYMGSTPATITITYFNYNGVTRTSTANVSATNRLFSFDQRYDTNLADQSVVYASAKITSNGTVGGNDKPFTAIVNVVGLGVNPGDAASSYAGINQ